MDYLAEIKAFYRNNISREDPQGCTEQQIIALEARLGFRFPIAYRQYLLWMGADYHGVYRGSNCFIDHVVSNTEELPQFLEEEPVNYVLPSRYVAFYAHQGYHYAWFEIIDNMDENPITYSLGEGLGWTKPMVDPTFTAFILGGIKDIAWYSSQFIIK